MPAPVEPPAFEAPAAAPSPAPSPAAEPAPEPFAPPAAEPAPEPAPEPFAPPAEEMPAEPAAQPDAAVEDLFKEPEPAPAKPATDVDDLFKDTEPAPAEPAAAGTDVDDLFKDTDSGKAASGETPAEAESGGDSDLDNLFNEPQEPSPMSAGAEPAPEPAQQFAAEADKLFAPEAGSAQPAVAEENVADTDSGMRLWTDNTGKYQVRARLVVVGPTHVRLLKENGKFTTVPYSRLSQQDLALVRSHGQQNVVASF